MNVKLVLGLIALGLLLVYGVCINIPSITSSKAYLYTDAYLSGNLPMGVSSGIGLSKFKASTEIGGCGGGVC